MKSAFFRFCLVTVLALCSIGGAAAGDVIIITHPGITLSTDEVKDVYLGEKQFAGSTRLVPVDNLAAQPEFLARFLQMNITRYNNAWNKKTFRDGLTPPTVKLSDAEVIEYVKRTPGAVGYIGSPGGVSIVK